MRKLILTACLFIFTLAAASAQVVVAEKLAPPAKMANRTLPEPRPGYLKTANGWVEKDGQYVFLAARIVKERPGFKYVPGKWRKVPGGWVFIGEEWLEITRL